MDPAQLSKLSEMDAELAQFLQQHQIPKPEWSDLAAFRTKRAQLEKERLQQQGPPGPGLSETFRSIKMRDGFDNRVKITNPDATGGPLIVLVFGGGFIVGNEEQLTPLARPLAKAFDAVVVAINYRLAPEHKFPTAAHDVEDSLLWLAENAATLGADPSKGFILGGISAGGNLTACIAQKTLEDRSLAYPLTGTWLCVPWIFPLDGKAVPAEYKDSFISREQNAVAPVLDKDALVAINNYLEPDASSPLCSPFNSTSPHKGLPPTCVQVAGLDPLRDDGLVYERILRDNGVKTRLNVWPGVPHAHFAFFPFLTASKKSMPDIIMGFGWLLESKKTIQEIQKVLA